MISPLAVEEEGGLGGQHEDDGGRGGRLSHGHLGLHHPHVVHRGPLLPLRRGRIISRIVGPRSESYLINEIIKHYNSWILGEVGG